MAQKYYSYNVTLLDDHLCYFEYKTYGFLGICKLRFDGFIVSAKREACAEISIPQIKEDSLLYQS